MIVKTGAKSRAMEWQIQTAGNQSGQCYEHLYPCPRIPQPVHQRTG